MQRRQKEDFHNEKLQKYHFSNEKAIKRLKVFFVKNDKKTTLS